ncbi:unknown similar to AMEV098 [Mythimna separata entomopoxvirus 'L']|uniref:Uncharacterized protein n=1 Tax=Mythimna separata entomopoxvirus 'L' TaxID=1293572 RepID=A0A916KQG8_9POXV|nr:unknown similar to AMEV098 [Mythimna separata entomopoxvirus 'L']CCU56316.1 unknown similar to AMEV098 [Mythimna separata entomopoxvirus 'L']
MNEDTINKHFSVMGFIDSAKLNMLLSTKSAGIQHDFLKEHIWYKINDTNWSALVYEDNGKKYAAKIYIHNDIDDVMGINDVDAYGGDSKKKVNPKNIKNSNKPTTIKQGNANPSGNGRRKKQNNTAKSNNDHSTNLMGEYK